MKYARNHGRLAETGSPTGGYGQVRRCLGSQRILGRTLDLAHAHAAQPEILGDVRKHLAWRPSIPWRRTITVCSGCVRPWRAPSRANEVIADESPQAALEERVMEAIEAASTSVALEGALNALTQPECTVIVLRHRIGGRQAKSSRTSPRSSA